MALTAARLVAGIEKLPHPERTRTVIDTARRLSGTSELDDLLSELYERDAWSQVLSLRMASASGHRDHVERCFTDGPLSLQLRAVGPAVRLGVDADALLTRLPDLPAALRGQLSAAVRVHRDEALADAVLGPLRARFGDREAAALLPGCSGPVVARELASLSYVVPSWTALTRRHPTQVLDHVDAELASSPRATWTPFLNQVVPALAAVALTEPDRVLRILEKVDGHTTLNGSLSRVLAALARREPARVLALVLSPRRTGAIPTGRKLWRAFTALDDDALAGLGRALEHHELVRLLHVVPPARRPALYDAVLGGHDLVERGMSTAVLDELPWSARHAEARRLLELRSVAADPVVRLQVTARLPWAEAEPVLRTAAARPLADDRSQAYALLIGAAAATRDPLVVQGLLAALERLHNEQELVRAVALNHLARIPMRFVTDTAADLLTVQVAAAVQARDVSSASQSATRSISVRLLTEGLAADRPHLRDAGLGTIQDASGALDYFGLARLAGSLPRAADQLVHDALVPRFQGDQRRGRYDTVLLFAESLGRRAWVLPDLQKRIEKACSSVDDGVARRAMALWVAPPETRDARVGELVRKDPTVVAVTEVAEALATRRTDLLDKVLTKRPKGRFSPPGVRTVPPVARHCDKWTPRQVATYRSLLGGIVDDRRANPWERTAALRLLGRVPGSVDVVRAHLDDPSPQMADAALSAIAWTDDPAAALPDLLARAEGDRAHVAFSAATRCARFVPPADLAAPLAGVLAAGKVTARKEAVRLLAEHRPPGALATLTAELARADQHRDVRRAVVSSLRHLLDEEDAWTALGSVTADRPVATAVLETGPGWIAPQHRQRYALLVRDVAAHPDADLATQGLWAMSPWVRWDGTGALVALAGSGPPTSRTHG